MRLIAASLGYIRFEFKLRNDHLKVSLLRLEYVKIFVCSSGSTGFVDQKERRAPKKIVEQLNVSRS